MSEEQYNELLKAYTKEVLGSMIKADIRNSDHSAKMIPPVALK